MSSNGISLPWARKSSRQPLFSCRTSEIPQICTRSLKALQMLTPEHIEGKAAYEDEPPRQVLGLHAGWKSKLRSGYRTLHIPIIPRVYEPCNGMGCLDCLCAHLKPWWLQPNTDLWCLHSDHRDFKQASYKLYIHQTDEVKLFAIYEINDVVRVWE